MGTHCSNESQQFAAPNWSNVAKNEKYQRLLYEKLQKVPIPEADDIQRRDNLQAFIDEYIGQINNAIHMSSREAGCTPHHNFKPKPYWCPELSVIRDRKRFWYSIWSQNGKPRSGVVFECYKGVKISYEINKEEYIQPPTTGLYQAQLTFQSEEKRMPSGML